MSMERERYDLQKHAKGRRISAANRRPFACLLTKETAGNETRHLKT